MKRFLLTLLVTIITFTSWAGEGMWLPFLLKQLNEAEMQTMGMKLSAEDIYSVNQGSLKDAIVHFGGFCTAEVISPEGLILTNWHCGRGSIQSHSSLDNNYLTEGFWAKNRGEELQNPRLSATFIVRMEDVTKQVLKGVDDSASQEAQQSRIDKNINTVIASCKKETYEEAIIKPFFKGNQYVLIVTVTYRDVRLVGTPPQMIGEFGKDTDNWVWPRHTGDFSLFRIYAGQDNKPADYSPNNRPLQPKHFLPVSLDGVEEGDFTMVFGFPGSTDEYLPAAAVEQIVYKRNPVRIAIRDKTLGIMDQKMREDEEIKIQYTAKFSGLSNSWKRWKGEMLGMKRTGGLEKIRAMEEEFIRKVNSDREWKKAYGDILPTLNKKYADLEPYVLARDYYSEITGRNIEIFQAANMAYRLISAYKENGEAGFEQMKDRLSSWFDRFYKDYQPDIDEEVFEALMAMYIQDLPTEFVSGLVIQKAAPTAANPQGNSAGLAKEVFSGSYLLTEGSFNGVMERGPEMGIQSLSNDPAILLVRDMLETYNEKVAPGFNELQTEIYQLEKAYMKALMDVFPDRTFYPDANSTLRVTYGKVDGYQARDAVIFEPNTTLEGVFEKYVPGDYEFDVPKKLLDLYNNKDYGPYGENGEMPVCFIGTNHTTGGNSGSPAIDAHGNLVGLNFDRAWEGVMSDYYYDSSICRNIMVDVRYILFIIDKFAGAGHLVDEMKLVHPKK